MSGLLGFLQFFESVVIIYSHVAIIRPLPSYPEVNSTTLANPNITDDQLREHLCPGVSDFGYRGNFIRYYNKTRRCYSIATQGPCENNLIFHAEVNNTVFGQCDCGNYVNTRTLIYHPVTNQCYLIFTQAYCKTSKWVILNPKNGKPVCERNPCHNSKRTSKEDEFVQVNNRCVKLNSKCDGGNGIILFTKGKILPHCANPPSVAYAMGAPTIETCAPGSYVSISGNCQSSWNW